MYVTSFVFLIYKFATIPLGNITIVVQAKRALEDKRAQRKTEKKHYMKRTVVIDNSYERIEVP